MIDSTMPQRLHPIALITEFIKLIRGWLIPMGLLIISLAPWFMKHQLTWLIYVSLIALILGFLVPASLRYWTFKFAITPNGLVIYSGVFNHQVNHIPFNRIQSINRTQWAFLKPFHLISISIETAGHSADDRPEAVLSAVTAVTYQQLLQAQKADAGDSPAAPQVPSYTINPHDLHEFALTSPAFLSALLVMLAGFGKLGHNTQTDLINWAFSNAHFINLWLIIGLIIGVLVVFYLVAMLVLIMTYYGFNLTREKDHLIIRRGWFKERQTEIAIDRIQAIRLKQPLVRHWLKLVTVQLVVISNDHHEKDAANIIIMPVIKRAMVNSFLATFFPQLPPLTFAQNKLPRTRWSILRNYLLAALVVVLPISLLWRPWATNIIAPTTHGCVS